MTARLVMLLVIVLIGWGLFSAWQLGQARRAVGEDRLDMAGKLTAGDRAAAQRFLAKTPALRRQFVAAASAAEKREDDPATVAAVRAALQRALAAAAANDAGAAGAHLRSAESALDGAGAVAGSGVETVIARVLQIEPAMRLGRELMTEGHAAAERLVARASWHHTAGRHGDALRLLDLALQLTGAEVSTAGAPTNAPAWFVEMSQAPPASADKARTEDAVRVCEAAAAAAPSRAVTILVGRARRELDAGRVAEAWWWASVALRALDMTEDAVAGAGSAEGARR